MKTKVLILRALAAVFIKKALRLVVIIAASVLLIFLIITWLLAINVSSWWWLLLLPLFVALFVLSLVFVVAYFILRTIYPDKLSAAQKQQLERFSTKVQKLLEARTMGWPLFLMICLKDLVLHKELRSLKQLLSDSTSLRKDFTNLEDAFTAQVG